MIIRVKHNPTILALELSTCKELHKIVTSHTDQYRKRLSCINLHDHTHQALPNHLGCGVMSMERATQDGYILHQSIHEKFIMHQPSWSYATSITQPFWRWSCQHGKNYARCYTSHIDQYTNRLWCINLHDHTQQALPNHLGFGVMSMETATQDDYITHPSIHEKTVMHQPS